MNKSELVDVFMKKANNKYALGISSKHMAEKFVDAMLDSVCDVVSDDKDINIHGFGELYVDDRKSHIGRNPKTGEAIDIPIHKVIKFKVGKRLKDCINPK